ncbi:replication initiation and membrane attachment family protein [Bacillus tuaregi]|uniref:hypothetical protein n=1 Tax=Bacillus tuaregi TaxID=1816695 RepID=UPI0008F921DF|nr:hypothetical protein [Bacillus tuaregi]
MFDETIILEEKERKLAEFLEANTTEEVLMEVQEYVPSLTPQSKVIQKLKEMKLPQPVINTLIYFVLATNKQSLATAKLMALADLCRKYNISNAQSAITFFKQYYHVFQNQISQQY